MRRVLWSLVTAVLVLVVVPAGQASGAGDAGDDHRRVVEYWTPERRASAIPLDVIVRGKPDAQAGKPGGGDGSVTGATWTQGGSVSYTTGKVFFTKGTSRYTCSGSAVDSAHGNLVLTAGHCVNGGSGAGFVTNWIFYPHWNGAPDADLGGWTATDLFTTELWANTSNGFDDDAGFAVVTKTASASLESTLATLAGATVPTVAFTEPAAGTNVYAFGYPAAKRYNGNTLTYCAGGVRVRYDGNETLALGCNMTGGSSGGPWFTGFSTTTKTGSVSSLNSYGYASVKNVMFGPIFDSDELAAYEAADTSPDCSAAPSGYVCADQSD